jgi:hypothetical protein
MDNVQNCDCYHSFLFLTLLRKHHRLLVRINMLDSENEGDGEMEIYEGRKRGKEV